MIAKRVAQKLTKANVDYSTWYQQLANLAEDKNIDLEQFTSQALQQGWSQYADDPLSFLEILDHDLYEDQPQCSSSTNGRHHPVCYGEAKDGTEFYKCQSCGLDLGEM